MGRPGRRHDRGVRGR
ncbi:hypothetical protein OG882_23480 [Streptomyces anulatus]|nr:hypothetical protein OG882_23480 [Streptomyces anulatus]